MDEDGSGAAAPGAARRDFLTGLGRGLCRRCPDCGQGRLFDGYLRVRPVCDACGHDNDRYPADDAPPYFTILLVGHLVVAPLLTLAIVRDTPLWLSIGAVCTLVLACTLLLLPRVKGAVIGACWAFGIVREPVGEPASPP